MKKLLALRCTAPFLVMAALCAQVAGAYGADAGQAAGTTVSRLGIGSLSGHWQAQKKGKDVEFGPEMASSTVGLPAGQQMGAIGNGRVGTSYWGMRNSYKTFEVERQGDLRLEPDGRMSWTGATSSRRSADCIRVTEFSMSGTATMAGDKLMLDIAQGQQKIFYRGCPGAKTSVQIERLDKQQRGYEVKLEAGSMKIRQVQPVSSVSSAAVYERR